MAFQLWKKNKITIKKFNNKTGDSELCLLSFDGEIRDKIIKNFNQNFLIEGDHIKNGGKSSTKTMLSLLGASGTSLGISAATSSQLFLATANPATLMTIGNGVGSAVMGTGGIVAQAPFVSLAGAIMPVVAPLVAFQALTTIMLLNEFKGINRKLDKIEKSVNRIIKRDEATYVGEIISASNRITDIEKQFAISNQFTVDMIIRLALLEDKVNPIFERYNYLYSNQIVNTEIKLEDLKFKQNDAYFAILLSILDILIDLLRLKLTIQDNPGFMEQAAKQFTKKIIFYNDLWVKIRNDPSQVMEISDQMKETIEEMNWWQKKVPSWIGGNRKKRIELEIKSNEFKEESYKQQINFKDNIDNALKIGEISKNLVSQENPMNLIYWKDEKGEHSYYTDDLMIEVNN